MEKASKKEHILIAAETLFADKGYEATSIRDIARRANVNIAMISYYFGSKEKLMEHLFKQHMLAGQDSVKALVINKDLGAMQKLELMIDGYMLRVKSKTNFYKVSITEQLINKNKTIIDLYFAFKKEYADAFFKILDEGYRNGEFSYKYDNIMLLNLFNGFVMQTNINQNFYKSYNKITKNPLDFEEAYFGEAVTHFKIILKRILGYDENK